VSVALAEAKDAYNVWSSIQVNREKALIEKCNRKPAPYKHVKVMISLVTYSAQLSWPCMLLSYQLQFFECCLNVDIRISCKFFSCLRVNHCCR
jgi:hypothetical protein